MSVAVHKYYIMGCGKLGRYLDDYFKKHECGVFLGFLDNKAIGNNIFKPKDAEDKKATVYVGSINYMYEMKKELQSLGYTNIVTFAELILRYPELQNFSQSFMGLRDDYKNNKNKYEQLRNILVDEKSKKVLDTLVEFRKTFDINLYSKIADDISKQYFEEFMPKDVEVFIDGGGYDGDTVLRALQYISPSKVYFFEPDEISLNKAKETLCSIKNIEYFSYGLSNKNKTLKFNSNGGTGSCFDQNGNTEVKSVALDEIVKENKAFIKLDIEGAEMDAINGAKKLIKNGSPFAICVYHKPSDIWKIPELLLKISCNKTLGSAKKENLNFYLRHYTNTIFETVLYGVLSND